MTKLIVTEWDGRILTALFEEGRCRSLSLNPKDGQSLVGNIYIGKVKHVVKNIGAAFIDLGNGVTGYYSLSENQAHLFAGAPSGKEKRAVRQGDELIVQVSRDAVKTKDPVLTFNLSFTGK